MGTISDYPQPSRALDGNEAVAGFQDGSQVAIPAKQIAALAIPAATAAAKVYADQADAAAKSIAGTQEAFASTRYLDLAPNLFPEVIRFGPGDCTIDPTGLLGDGAGMIQLPAVIEVRKGRTIYGGDPVATSADPSVAKLSVLDGHLVLKYDLTQPQAVWYDAKANWYRVNTLDVYMADLANDDVGEFAQAILLAVVVGDKVVSPIAFRVAGDGIGANAAPWGSDITAAPYRIAGASVTPVADVVLTGRGLTQAVWGGANRVAYVGGALVTAVKQGARIFARLWAESSDDGVPADMDVNLWRGAPEASDFIANVQGRLERRWSARVCSYVVSIAAPAGLGGMSFGARPSASASATATLGIAAVQYACGDGPARWIRQDDFAAPAGQGIVTIDATFPPAIYFRSGRPIDFNPANALSDLALANGLVASVASVGDRGARPLVKSSADTIELDPARMGATITVNFQSRAASGAAVNPWPSQDLAVVKGSRTDAQVGLILSDSKGHQSLASDLKAKYEAIAGAGKLTMIGTIPDGDNPAVKTEGHRGWGVADITHASTKYPAVPAASRKPGYAQDTPDGVPSSNVFIVPDDGSYPGGVPQNGYAFDLRRYLTDFGFPDPHFVVVELGVNDMTPTQDDTALAALLNKSWGIVYNQTRTALPNARIIFTQWALGHQDFVGTATPLLWSRFHRFLIRQQRLFVANLNDANCVFVGTYLHVDRRIDYPPYLDATDVYGLQTVQAYNALHEGPANRSAGAEAILGAISW